MIKNTYFKNNSYSLEIESGEYLMAAVIDLVCVCVCVCVCV